jgi:hypothetical protein
MHGDQQHPNEAPSPDDIDPSALKDALGRTGRMLQAAGLPFEEEEFEELDAAAGDTAPVAEEPGDSASS